MDLPNVACASNFKIGIVVGDLQAAAESDATRDQKHLDILSQMLYIRASFGRLLLLRVRFSFGGGALRTESDSVNEVLPFVYGRGLLVMLLRVCRGFNLLHLLSRCCLQRTYDARHDASLVPVPCNGVRWSQREVGYVK